MSEEVKALESMIGEEYKYGFTTDVEYEEFPKGISEDIIKELSARKNEPEWMTEFRLNAYRAWKDMEEPTWFNLELHLPSRPPLRHQTQGPPPRRLVRSSLLCSLQHTHLRPLRCPRS